MAAASFTVNACNSDAQFLEPTLRHMLPALNYPFAERLVAYDPGRQKGKYAAPVPAATARRWKRYCSACWPPG